MPPEDNQQPDPQQPGQQFNPLPKTSDVENEVAEISDSSPAPTGGGIAEPSSEDQAPADQPATVEFPKEADSTIESLGPEEPVEAEETAPAEPVIEEPSVVEPTPTVEEPSIEESPKIDDSSETLSSTEPIESTETPTTPEVTADLATEAPVPATEVTTTTPAIDPTAGAYVGASGASAKKSGKKKSTKIIILALVVVAVVAGVLFFLLVLKSLQIPKYSNLSQVNIAGQPDSSTGMTFSIPEQFVEANKTDNSATYYDYIGEDSYKGKIYAETAGSVEVLTTQELKESEISAFLDQVESTAKDPESLSGIVSDDTFTNVKLSSIDKDAGAGTARLEITGDMKVDDKTSPGKIVIVLTVSKTGVLYTFGISASDEIWQKNSEVFEEMLNSVKVDQQTGSTAS